MWFFFNSALSIKWRNSWDVFGMLILPIINCWPCSHLSHPDQKQTTPWNGLYKTGNSGVEIEPGGSHFSLCVILLYCFCGNKATSEQQQIWSGLNRCTFLYVSSLPCCNVNSYEECFVILFFETVMNVGIGCTISGLLNLACVIHMALHVQLSDVLWALK